MQQSCFHLNQWEQMSQWWLVNMKPQFQLLNFRVFCGERQKTDNVNENSKFNKTNYGCFVGFFLCMPRKIRTVPDFL